MTTKHYENFPVASFLLPRKLRRPISLIYDFARQADDFADEGDLSPNERLALLDGFREELTRIETAARAETQLFRDLAVVITEFRLPFQLFRDLLDAFSQDVTKNRYANFAEVMQYCRRSANPVGRLLLHLYGATDRRNLAYSDAICSSLQLINFLQDIAIDYRKGRIYLAQDEMEKYKINESQIASGDNGGMWGMFMLSQIDRTRALLQAGAPLGKLLPGRIGLEMRMIIMGGESILRKLHHSQGDVFHRRPVLQPADWAYMLYRSIRAN